MDHTKVTEVTKGGIGNRVSPDNFYISFVTFV
jgi:hypothetical protein